MQGCSATAVWFLSTYTIIYENANQQPVAVFTIGIQLLAVDIEPGNKLGHKALIDVLTKRIGEAILIHTQLCHRRALQYMVIGYTNIRMIMIVAIDEPHLYRSHSSSFLRIYIWSCSYIQPIPASLLYHKHRALNAHEL